MKEKNKMLDYTQFYELWLDSEKELDKFKIEYKKYHGTEAFAQKFHSLFIGYENNNRLLETNEQLSLSEYTNIILIEFPQMGQSKGCDLKEFLEEEKLLMREII